MLIGHLPAGYLATTLALDRLEVDAAQRKKLLAVGLVCSVLPDVDTLYFYLVDASRHHHSLLPHQPLFWLALAGGALLIARAARSSFAARAAWIGGGNLLLHLALDSIAGRIQWGWPFSEAYLTLVAVPARYDSWILSFLTHWTFALELAVVVAAGGLWWHRRQRI